MAHDAAGPRLRCFHPGECRGQRGRLPRGRPAVPHHGLAAGGKSLPRPARQRDCPLPRNRRAEPLFRRQRGEHRADGGQALQGEGETAVRADLDHGFHHLGPAGADIQRGKGEFAQ